MSLLKIAQWIYGKPSPDKVNFIDTPRNRREARKKEMLKFKSKIKNPKP